MLIAQLTDLHLRPAGLAAYRMVDTSALAEQALRAVAALDPVPDAMVISGDLADTAADEEYALLSVLLRRHLRLPVYVIPGNHDRRAAMRTGLGHLPGLGGSGRFLHYVVEDPRLRLIMLDTLVEGAAHGELCDERLEFLDRSLAEFPDRPALLVMHHPPFACGIGHMDAIGLRNQEAFAAIIRRHPQVERVVCGHNHRPVIGRVAQATVSIAPSVAHQMELMLRPGVAGAMVMEPPAFPLHRWTSAKGLVTHTVYVESYPGPFPFQTQPSPPVQTAPRRGEEQSKPQGGRPKASVPHISAGGGCLRIRQR